MMAVIVIPIITTVLRVTANAKIAMLFTMTMPY